MYTLVTVTYDAGVWTKTVPMTVPLGEIVTVVGAASGDAPVCNLVIVVYEPGVATMYVPGAVLRGATVEMVVGAVTPGLPPV